MRPPRMVRNRGAVPRLLPVRRLHGRRCRSGPRAMPGDPSRAMATPPRTSMPIRRGRAGRCRCQHARRPCGRVRASRRNRSRTSCYEAERRSERPSGGRQPQQQRAQVADYNNAYREYDEEYAEEEPRGRSGPLILLLALLALAVIVGVLIFFYTQNFNLPASSAAANHDIPVIAPSEGPAKASPEPQVDTSSSPPGPAAASNAPQPMQGRKQIYDRILGEEAVEQNKLVPTEEQPVAPPRSGGGEDLGQTTTGGGAPLPEPAPDSGTPAELQGHDSTAPEPLPLPPPPGVQGSNEPQPDAAGNNGDTLIEPTAEQSEATPEPSLIRPVASRPQPQPSRSRSRSRTRWPRPTRPPRPLRPRVRVRRAAPAARAASAPSRRAADRPVRQRQSRRGPPRPARPCRRPRARPLSTPCRRRPERWPASHRRWGHRSDLPASRASRSHRPAAPPIRDRRQRRRAPASPPISISSSARRSSRRARRSGRSGRGAMSIRWTGCARRCPGRSSVPAPQQQRRHGRAAAGRPAAGRAAAAFLHRAAGLRAASRRPRPWRRRPPAARVQQPSAARITPPPAPAVRPQQQAALIPATTPAVAGGAGYVVQLASFRSEVEAAGEFRRLQSRHPQLVGALQQRIQRADLGASGTFYRLGVGPLGNKDQASRLCNSLHRGRREGLPGSSTVGFPPAMGGTHEQRLHLRLCRHHAHARRAGVVCRGAAVGLDFVPAQYCGSAAGAGPDRVLSRCGRR